MKGIKKDFSTELVEISYAMQQEFVEEIEKFLYLELKKFKTQVQQEIKNIIKQTQNNNFRNLQEDIIHSVLFNKLSINQLLKKLSQLIINRTL